jgi:hypothetical protein
VLTSLRPPPRQAELCKVDRLGCGFGSSRYSVPQALVRAQVELLARTPGATLR